MNALSFSIIDLSAVPYGGFEIWSGSQVQKPPSQNNEIDAGLADSVKMMKYILGKIVEMSRAEYIRYYTNSPLFAKPDRGKNPELGVKPNLVQNKNW